LLRTLIFYFGLKILNKIMGFGLKIKGTYEHKIFKWLFQTSCHFNIHVFDFLSFLDFDLRSADSVSMFLIFVHSATGLQVLKLAYSIIF